MFNGFYSNNGIACVCVSDREYPRLGQMIVDYENPLKKMMEEFVPHGKVRELFYSSVVYRLLCSFQMPLTLSLNWRLFKGIQCVKFRAYIKMLYVMFSRLEICFN